VEQYLREGNVRAANSALAAARQLAVATEPPVLAVAELEAMQRMIETMPPAAVQVLRYAPSSPFSALGVERLAAARELNTQNKRQLLKRYRKLALELHPDRCDHALACDAMQALNTAYEKMERQQPRCRAS